MAIPYAFLITMGSTVFPVIDAASMGLAAVPDMRAPSQPLRRDLMAMKSRPPSSNSRMPGEKHQGQPAPGSAQPGKTFDPTQAPTERVTEEGTRSAPAPGVPMSNEQYEWLKRKATKTKKTPSTSGQEDPSAKKGYRR